MPIANWIVQNTLAASLLALVVAAACRWGRFAPALRHGLWLVVLLKLVTPPFASIPVPVPQWLLVQIAPPPTPVESTERSAAVGGPGAAAPARASHDCTLSPAAAAQFAGLPDESNDVASPMLAAVDPAEDTGLEQPSTVRPGVPLDVDDLQSLTDVDRGEVATGPQAFAVDGPGQWWTWTSPVVWLGWGWLAGTAMFVLIQARRIINLRCLIAGGRMGGGALDALVVAVAGEMGVQPPPVKIVPRLPSPALCAWGRVVLLWPEGPLDHLSPAGRKAVVLHELAHLKRRDHWTGWVELLAGCGWWWNPLYWYVRHQLRENAELACDAWVVARLPDGRRAYAEALIDAAQGEREIQLSGMVLGVGDGSRRLLERRLVMIMRGGVRYQIPVLGLAAIALVAVATLPRWSIAQHANNPVIVASGNTGESGGDVTGLPAAATGSETEILAQPVAGPVSFLVAVPEAPTAPAVPGAEEAPTEELSVSAFATEEGAGFSVPVASPQAFTITAVAPPVADENAGAGDVAARLTRVEEQLGVLLKEMRAIKELRPTATDRKPAAGVLIGQPATGILIEQSGTARKATAAPAQPRAKPVVVARGGPPHSGEADPNVVFNLVENTPVKTVTMMRTTYMLPQGHAEALARGLTAQLNDDVEIKVKGDALQITAVNEDQQAIGHLIQLIKRKGRTSGTGLTWYPVESSARRSPPVPEY